VDGVPAVEVACELGMTAGAVRQAKYRILRRLRQETDGLLD
jgi:DNA-directed RNA polymerase specialized sigma24 family protein